MRNPVSRFEVDVHDIYEDARASMAPKEPRRWPMAVLTTAVAIAIGATAGLVIGQQQGQQLGVPLLPWLVSGLAVEPGDAGGMPAFQASEPASRSLLAMATRHRAVAAPTPAPAGARWPIVLQRAGDGRFYADLSLDGHLFNILVDPAAPASRLTPAELPGAVSPEAGEWPAVDVLLEHLRLPPTTFGISAEPLDEAAIGADLLGRHFLVEEQFDRLRLVPRPDGS